MSFLDRFRRSPPDEVRASAPYNDAIVQAIIQAASGRAQASADATGAVEAAASAYGRCFAAAKVTPAGPLTDWLTAEVRNLIGRELIRRGEQIHRLRIVDGKVRAAPAGSWDVRGGPDRAEWFYRLDEFGPSGNHTRFVPGDGVIHCRYAYDPSRPWLGLSPIHVASATGRLHAETVVALADEASGPRGSLLPMPQDGEDDNLDGLREGLPKLRGKMATVETTAAGFGEGPQAAPSEDWKQKRIGAQIPDSLRNLRSDSAKDVLSACGVPVELVTAADGTGQREAWRRFTFGSVQPLARIVEAELSAKLGVRIAFDFSDLMASDLAGRARAFQSMVGAGMDTAKAAGLAGLMSPEG